MKQHALSILSLAFFSWTLYGRSSTAQGLNQKLPQLKEVTPKEGSEQGSVKGGQIINKSSGYDVFENRTHTADTVLMVRPVEFAFNEQTAVDNEFQHKPSAESKVTNFQAMKEFETAVLLLQQNGVKVLVLEREEVPRGMKTPDAVFPNNWFSTHPDGSLIVYPMATVNRRAETRRLPDVENLLKHQGFCIKHVEKLSKLEENEKFLEGTGSMVIDHLHSVVYAAISVRTCPEQLQKFAEMQRYKRVIMFNTASSSRMGFYHTNVMMSIGEGFVVICTDCIATEQERKTVLDALKATHRDIIFITLEQAEKHFCGNILQVRNKNQERIIVMSQSAFDGFTHEQRATLSKHGKLVSLPVKTIEHVGGGSARCMLAEIFLPKTAQTYT